MICWQAVLLTPASLRFPTLSSLRGKKGEKTGFIAVGFSQRIAGRPICPGLVKIDGIWLKPFCGAIPSLERDGNGMLAGGFTHPGIATLADPLFATRKEGEEDGFHCRWLQPTDSGQATYPGLVKIDKAVFG